MRESGIARHTAAVCLLMVAVRTAGASAGTEAPRALAGIHRILVLGDSNTYAGGYVAALESVVRLHVGPRMPEIINLGLPSETVSGLSEPHHAGGAFPRPDLHERLARALALVKPDLVTACYGMNDGIYYPYSRERFERFQRGMTALRNAVLASGAEFWALTPPPFDARAARASVLPEGAGEYGSDHPFAGYDGVLERYSRWLLGRRRAGWHVVDVRTPIAQELARRRAAEPGFQFSSDGVHFDEGAHEIVATALLKAWGAPAEWLAARNAPALDSLVRERQALLRDSWLTAVGHKRPGMSAGLPPDEARRQAAELERRIEMLPRPEGRSPDGS